MGVSVRQVYGAAWNDLRGMPKAWLNLALLLVGPLWGSLVLTAIKMGWVGQIASFITALIAIRVALNIVDGRQSVMDGVVPPVMTYLKLLAAVFIASVPIFLLGIVAGAVSFIAVPLFLIAAVGAVVIMVVLTVYNYVMAETGCGIIEGFERTLHLVQRQPRALVVFVIAAMLLNIGGLLLATLGLIVTLPLTVVAGARVYRALQVSDAVVVPAPTEATV